MIDHFLYFIVQGLSLGGKLGIFLLLKSYRMFSFLYFCKDLSFHVKEIDFLADFKVELFGDEFEFLFEEGFAVLRFFEGVDEFLMLG